MGSDIFTFRDPSIRFSVRARRAGSNYYIDGAKSRFVRRDADALASFGPILDALTDRNPKESGYNISLVAVVAPVIIAASGEPNTALRLLHGAVEATRHLDFDYPLASADCLLGFAVVAALQGDWPRASHLFAFAAEQGRGRPLVVRTPASYALYHHYTPLVRCALGPEQARRFRDERQHMTLDEAINYALKNA